MSVFGLSVQTVETSSKLVVSNPANFGPMLAAFIFLVLPLLYMLRMNPFPKVKFAIVFCLALFAFAFTIDSTQVVLDRVAQSATFREFHYYHWKSASMPLSDIDKAYLSTGRSTSRITFQFKDGGVRDLSYADDMSGKPAAVSAINRFLGRN